MAFTPSGNFALFIAYGIDRYTDIKFNVISYVKIIYGDKEITNSALELVWAKVIY